MTRPRTRVVLGHDTNNLFVKSLWSPSTINCQVFFKDFYSLCSCHPLLSYSHRRSTTRAAGSTSRGRVASPGRGSSTATGTRPTPVSTATQRGEQGYPAPCTLTALTDNPTVSVITQHHNNKPLSNTQRRRQRIKKHRIIHGLCY